MMQASLPLSCLLLAAGQSRRMQGPNKLLLPVQGRSLVGRTLDQIRLLPFAETIVVTGHQSDEVMAELGGPQEGVRFVHNPDFATGLHSSIRRGLLAMQDPRRSFVICLSDQPQFNAGLLNHLVQTFLRASADAIVFPTYQGQRGHPVLISHSYRDEILREPDRDSGCAYLFKRHSQNLISVATDSEGCLLDIDEPRDYLLYGGFHGT